MTNPGYEERLEVRLQSELDYYGEDMVVGSQGIRTIIDALADLRKQRDEAESASMAATYRQIISTQQDEIAALRNQRDEAERLIEVGASNLYIIQSENERLAIENATLRAENERLTRERDADKVVREKARILVQGLDSHETGLAYSTNKAVAELRTELREIASQYSIYDWKHEHYTSIANALAAAEAEAERLRKVLEDIAQQNLTREMPEPHDGDIPDGYDECIRVARAALTLDLSSKED